MKADDDPVDRGHAGANGTTRGRPSELGPRVRTATERRWRLTHRALPARRRWRSLARRGRGRGRGAESGRERGAARLRPRLGARRLRGDARPARRRAAGARQPARLRRRLPRAPPPPPRPPAFGSATPGERRRHGAAAGEVARGSSAPCAARCCCRSSDGAVDWSPQLVFPGLRPGRGADPPDATRPSARAILSRDGKVLAEGPAGSRTSPLGASAARSPARVGPAADQAERASAVRARLPARHARRACRASSAPSRTSWRARPAAQLIGGRARARTSPARAGATPVRTTIDSRLQQAAVTGAGRALRRRSPRSTPAPARSAPSPGIAFSAPQPPGSTFKIVTTTAALEAGTVKPTRPVPGRDAGGDRRRRARERQRRVLRRHVRARASPTRATRCSRRSG